MSYKEDPARFSFVPTVSGATELDYHTTAGVRFAVVGAYKVRLVGDTSYTVQYMAAGVHQPLVLSHIHSSGSIAATGIVGYYRDGTDAK